MHNLVSKLSKAVGASFNQTSYDRSNHSFRFKLVSAVYYLENIKSGLSSLDGRLLSYIAQTFMELVEKLKNNDSIEANITSNLVLDLDCVIRASYIKDRKTSYKTFGNIFPSELYSSSPSNESLALVLRAMNSSKYCENTPEEVSKKKKRLHKTDGVSSGEKCASQFIEKILYVLESCYFSASELDM